PWFRLYTEFSTDYKVQMMSEAFQRRFVMLMCFQREGVLNALTDEEISYRLGISKSQWMKTKKEFEKRGFLNSFERISNGDDFLRAFSSRQYDSDCSSDRVRQFRKNAA